MAFIIIATVVSIGYASGLEWAIHRFLMHRPIWKFRYAFHRHALTHHRIFKSDDTYHLQREKDKHTIPMAWWNGPALILLATLPSIPFSWWLERWTLSLIVMIACGAYYGIYERVHWCMHLPKERRIEASWFFRRLNGHHLLHHRYMNRNLNVVLPLADLAFGTLMLRSKVCFAQAQGPTVPDVQPRQDRPALRH